MPRPWSVAAATVLCVLVALLLLREPLGRWLYPDAALAGLLAQAEQALAEGDALTAAARFQAAQARAPDHPRITSGIADTRALVLRLAAEALDDGRPEAADGLIAKAEALGAPGDRLDALRRARQAWDQPSIESRLQRAVASEGGDPEAALADYEAVLALEPGNAVARHGRGRLLSALLQRATQHLDRGEFEPAAALVARVRRSDPAHWQLPDVETRLGALSGGREPPPSVSPAAVAPEAAREAARWRGLAEEALGRGAWARAGEAIRQARGFDPTAPELPVLEDRLRRAQADDGRR